MRCAPPARTATTRAATPAVTPLSCRGRWRDGPAGPARPRRTAAPRGPAPAARPAPRPRRAAAASEQPGSVRSARSTATSGQRPLALRVGDPGQHGAERRVVGRRRDRDTGAAAARAGPRDGRGTRRRPGRGRAPRAAPRPGPRRPRGPRRPAAAPTGPAPPASGPAHAAARPPGPPAAAGAGRPAPAPAAAAPRRPRARGPGDRGDELGPAREDARPPKACSAATASTWRARLLHRPALRRAAREPAGVGPPAAVAHQERLGDRHPQLLQAGLDRATSRDQGCSSPDGASRVDEQQGRPRAVRDQGARTTCSTSAGESARSTRSTRPIRERGPRSESRPGSPAARKPTSRGATAAISPGVRRRGDVGSMRAGCGAGAPPSAPRCDLWRSSALWMPRRGASRPVLRARSLRP